MEGAELTFDVDMIIPAIGQRLEESVTCVTTERGKLCADPRTLALVIGAATGDALIELRAQMEPVSKEPVSKEEEAADS